MGKAGARVISIDTNKTMFYRRLLPRSRVIIFRWTRMRCGAHDCWRTAVRCSFCIRRTRRRRRRRRRSMNLFAAGRFEHTPPPPPLQEDGRSGGAHAHTQTQHRALRRLCNILFSVQPLTHSRTHPFALDPASSSVPEIITSATRRRRPQSNDRRCHQKFVRDYPPRFRTPDVRGHFPIYNGIIFLPFFFPGFHLSRLPVSISGDP